MKLVFRLRLFRPGQFVDLLICRFGDLGKTGLHHEVDGVQFELNLCFS